MLTRRSMVLGLIAAPAVVRASSLMPVKSLLGLRGNTDWMYTYKDEEVFTIYFDAFQREMQRTIEETIRSVVPIHYTDAGMKQLQAALDASTERVFGPFLHQTTVTFDLLPG